MIQSSEIRKGKKRLIIFVYLGLMLLFYMGYIFLDNYRLNKSEQWLNIAYLTEVDIQSIEQLGFWTSLLEFLFLGLFVLITLLLFRYRKNRKTLTNFIIIHLGLFTAIFLMGYILSFFLLAPIGNLTQPLIAPSFLLVIIIIFTVARLIRECLSKRFNSVDTL